MKSGREQRKARFLDRLFAIYMYEGETTFGNMLSLSEEQEEEGERGSTCAMAAILVADYVRGSHPDLASMMDREEVGHGNG